MCIRDRLGLKHQMLPVNLLKGFSSIDASKSYSICKESMKEDIKQYSQKLGVDGQGLLKNLVNIFDLFGLGDLEIEDVNTESKTAILKIIDKNFRDNYTADDKICHTVTAGILAGMFSFVFSDDMNCIEVQCMAFGYDSCKFMVKKEF